MTDDDSGRGNTQLAAAYAIATSASARAAQAWLVAKMLNANGQPATRKRIAELCRCSTMTLRPALDELAALGAAILHRQHVEINTLWKTTPLSPQDVHRTRQQSGTAQLEALPGFSTVSTGPTTTATNGASIPSEGSSPALPESGTCQDLAPRKRDEVFDAIAEATSSNPRSEGTRIATAKKQIVGFVREDQPEASPAEIAAAVIQRAELYRQRWPSVELTPLALAKNWDRVAVEKPGAMGERDFDQIGVMFGGLD